MEMAVIVLKLIGVFGYLGMAAWWWITWLGMHNNTIDGNSFRLIYPFVVFDKSQFTEKGNYWRVRHLYVDVVAIIFSIGCWGYLYIEKTT